MMNAGTISVTNRLQGQLKAGRRHILPRRQVIQSLGENIGIAIIEKGYIKRYLITPDGAQSIQSIYGPGEIFPLTPMFKELIDLDISSSDETLYYEAMTLSQIRSISMNYLQDLVRDDPQIYQDLLYVAGMRLNNNIQRLENMSLGSSYRRLAHQLLYFAETFGKIRGDKVVIELPLTHADLAAVLNISRETISRNIIRLQRKGLIESNMLLAVNDIEALRNEVY